MHFSFNSVAASHFSPRANPSSNVVKLKLADNYSWIVTEEPAVLDCLRKQFQFLSKSFWFACSRYGSSANRMRFAGKTTFISEKGRFPTGLVDEISNRIKCMNLEVVKEDQRILFNENLPYHVVSNDIFGPSDAPLYDYQVDIANLALEEKQGIIKCATGGGKTLIFTAILKALSHLHHPALMLCRNKSIVNQTFDVFQAHGIQNVGIVHMDRFEPNIITCATAQSIHKIESLVKKTRIVIIDEVHEWSSKESEKILKSLNHCVYRLGFSATPFKDDMIHNYKLIGWFGSQLCNVGIDFLKEKSVLSSCRVHFYNIQVPLPIGPNGPRNLEVDHEFEPEEVGELGESKFDPSKSKNIDDSFLESDNRGIVQNMNLHLKVVHIVNSIPSGRILILVRRLHHGDRLKELLPDAHWIRGQDNFKSREHVLSQLRQSDEKKVVAIMSAIGFYGLNVLCHHLINACGGKDANLLIQKIGRGLRKGIDKDHLEYHDFNFIGDKYLHRHSRIRKQILISEKHEVVHEMD